MIAQYTRKTQLHLATMHIRKATQGEEITAPSFSYFNSICILSFYIVYFKSGLFRSE